MRFVETYAPPHPTSHVEVEERTYPAPCLLEDEDGIRLLFLPEEATQVPVQAWVQAHTAGAAAVVSGHRWALIEDLLERRIDRPSEAAYEIPDDAWSTSETPMTLYREMRDRGRSTDRPTESGTFVHVHAHSEYSRLDGLSRTEEMVAQAVADGQTALAITDHGICAGHPDLQAACDKAKIKPIFGIEANFTDDRTRRGDPEIKEGPGSSRYVLGDYYHLVLWAMDETGLRNLWSASTEANATGFYGRPRMDWEVLEAHSEGVMCGTGCLRGPLAQTLLEGDEARARTVLARMMDIFPDRLYVEIHTNQLPETLRLNAMLVDLADEYGLPIVASVDSHYPRAEDARSHQVWIAAQTDKDLTDDADLFTGEQQYHLMTEAEVRQALAYLGPQVVDRAVENTVHLAERCSVRIEGKTEPPIYSKVGANGDTSTTARIQRDVDRLVDMCLANWGKTEGKEHPSEEYEARFEREMRLLIDKQFCGYFLMVADYCAAAKDGRVMEAYCGRKEPIIVGPGRGSGGGSLVGYTCDITELDPVDSDLIFERFMTDGRVSLPDFDVDFPESKRDPLMAYIAQKYGEDHVLRVGTQVRLKNKGVVRDLARVLKNTIDIHYPDIDKVSKIIEAAEADKAGLGMPWEDLWIQHEEDLQPYRDKYPLLFEHADTLVGRLKSYGKHPAGVIIATDEPLVGRLPMRRAEADAPLVAEFSLDALESLGYVKFDLLTLRTLDTIQQAVDLVRATHGIELDLYHWREQYADPQIWEEISDGHTLGIFQIETRPGTKLTKRFRPRSISELADVITLVRPGPMRSGLTETYFRRKQGLEEVSFPDPRLEKVLAKTYGTMLYQEDIMAVCMVLAGYDSNEADAVRKILGKKQIEKVAEAGGKFVEAAVERGMGRPEAEHLWEQMAEFAKYSFNRAHAYGYAVLGHWTAWLKFHYPAIYLQALMTTVDKKRIPEFVTEARRMGYKVLPPDINLSGRGFSAHGIEIRYGLDNVKGIAEAGLLGVMKGQPYTSFQDFMARKGDGANAGIVKILAAVGAFDSLEPNRKALESRIAFDTEEANRCVHKDEKALGPGGLPCTFDWANEPNPPLVGQGRGKDRVMVPKPPPKRCTRACRNFTRPVFSADSLTPYTDEEIRDKEMALLGIHLSSTPFDVIPQEILDDECFTGDEVDSGPEGEYLVAATISRVKPHVTRTGRDMGFLTIFARDADLDVTVFSSEWEIYRSSLTPGRLCFLYLRKNERGINLLDLVPLN